MVAEERNSKHIPHGRSRGRHSEDIFVQTSISLSIFYSFLCAIVLIIFICLTIHYMIIRLMTTFLFSINNRLFDITASLFHSRLKTHLLHKPFPP